MAADPATTSSRKRASPNQSGQDQRRFTPGRVRPAAASRHAMCLESSSSLVSPREFSQPRGSQIVELAGERPCRMYSSPKRCRDSTLTCGNAAVRQRMHRAGNVGAPVALSCGDCMKHDVAPPPCVQHRQEAPWSCMPWVRLDLRDLPATVAPRIMVEPAHSSALASHRRPSDRPR